MGVGSLLLADVAGTSTLRDLRAAFDSLNGAASAQKTAHNPALSLLTWEDPWRCLLYGGHIMDGGDGGSRGGGGIGTEILPQCPACRAGGIAQGWGWGIGYHALGEAGGPVVHHIQGHGAPHGDGHRHCIRQRHIHPGRSPQWRQGPVVIVGGGGGKAVYVLYREGVGVSGSSGNTGLAPSGSAVLRRHSPFIILWK